MKNLVAGFIKNQHIIIKCNEPFAIDTLRIIIKPEKPYAYNLKIRASNSYDAFNPVFSHNRIKTGDFWFDRVVFIDGDNDMAIIGLLNTRSRILIYRLMNIGDLIVNSKHIIICLKYKSAEFLCGIINDLIELSELLSRNSNIKTNLIDNFFASKDYSVRKHNLDLLLNNFRLAKEEDHIIKRALHDPYWEIAFTAAEYLGKKGSVYFSDILKRTPPEFSAMLIQRIRKIMKNDSINVLINLYKKCSNYDIKLNLIKEIGKHKQQKAGDFLINLLYQRDMINQQAIIQALAKCGNVKALAPLYYLAKVVFKNPLLIRAARRAMARIQLRLGDVGKGCLSLTNTAKEEGELSLLKNKWGGLDIVEKKV